MEINFETFNREETNVLAILQSPQISIELTEFEENDFGYNVLINRNNSWDIIRIESFHDSHTQNLKSSMLEIYNKTKAEFNL